MKLSNMFLINVCSEINVFTSPKTVPKRLEDCSKQARDASKVSQDSSKTLQDGLKTFPRWSRVLHCVPRRLITAPGRVKIAATHCSEVFQNGQAWSFIYVCSEINVFTSPKKIPRRLKMVRRRSKTFPNWLETLPRRLTVSQGVSR